MIDVNRLMELMGEAKPPDSRSPLWPKNRSEWLKKNNKCAVCWGTEYLEVHHKIPFHVEPKLELVDSNFITLCEKPSRNCHFTWGHFYNWLQYNPKIELCINYWKRVRKNIINPPAV